MIHELLRAAPVLLVLLLISLSVLLYLRIYRFKRTQNDVIPYLRALDFEQLQDLLNPEQDIHFRQVLPRQQFREFQQKRVRITLEFLGRMSHDTDVLRGWGWYELTRSWRTRDRKTRRTSRQLVTGAVQCLVIGLAVRCKLHAWLFRMVLFPFLPTPNFADLMRLGSVDLLGFYEKTRTAALELAQAYGDEYRRRLALALLEFLPAAEYQDKTGPSSSPIA
ncbi:MAG TPA: hypothetical protein VJ723_07435 [Candidatus Angelobacter sp.]|nr:hypothetical protein [Candidatus Angelobacter sp.]